MKRLKKFFPEIASCLTSAIFGACSVVIYYPLRLSLNVLALGIFVVPVISACFYRAAKRPCMLMHLPIQMISFVAACTLTGTLLSILNGCIYNALDLLFALALGIFAWSIVAVFSATPALIVCAVYKVLFEKKLSQNPNQGSEQPKAPNEQPPTLEESEQSSLSETPDQGGSNDA